MNNFTLVKPLRKSFLPVSLVIIALLLTACGGSAITPTPEAGTFPIDPFFREFYASLGGQDVLGPAITTLFNYRANQCQYTVNALLCFDSRQQGIDRNSLFPLGGALGIKDEPRTTAEGDLVVDGYQIYEEFADLYQKLYRTLYTGKPLTQPRFNAEKNRIEQYFENVGFYRDLTDPAGEAHLLAYGVYACDSDCRYRPPKSSMVVTSIDNIEQPFLIQLARLGGLEVFGAALTNPYTAPDGRIEQVYENVVLSAPPDDLNNVNLRNLPVQLGMPSTAPAAQIYGEAQGVVFYAVDGELGYHVPMLFDHFIALHGGREISGIPLADIAQIERGLYQQCFEHYCLLYDIDAGESDKVRMAPLGVEYLRTTQGQPADEAAFFEVTPETVHLFANVSRPRVTASDEQQFEMVLLRASDQQPIADVEADLTLTLPDGKQEQFLLPPSDDSGRASLTVPALKPVPGNGSVIAFKVCLNVPSSQPICASDSYLIWNFQ